MDPPRLLLLDNIDSFTFMLGDSLVRAGASVDVVRNRAISVNTAIESYDGIVVSPGPGRPEEAGISVALAAACLETGKPFLGVCLGHQALALAAGGTVRREAPMHGKVDAIRHGGGRLFAGLPSPTTMTRYHSLVVDAAPAPLVATAWGHGGVLMAMEHPDKPLFGVQFHPESVASPDGVSLLANFVATIAA